MNLGAKTFAAADQATFAAFSGDRNPMHMDPLAARRTQMGAPVVHGVHGVLLALEAACAAEVLTISGIRVNFAGPILLGQPVVMRLAQRSERQMRITVEVDGAAATAITLTLGAPESEGPLSAVDRPAEAAWPAEAQTLALAEMARQAGAIAFAQGCEAAMAHFPHLSRTIGPERVNALASLSRLVGMVCPGLHSIFSGFKLSLVDGPADPVMRYRCVEADDRFQLVEVEVAGGGFRGSYRAFARIPPVAQPAVDEIASLVPKGGFAGAVCLVVGGSRGLGEVTAKACAAGGARVILTYLSGRAEAAAVAGQIRDFGGVCDVMSLDVRGDVAAQLAELPTRPTHLYYYATGPIAQRRSRLFSPQVLDDFLRVYATGFAEVCEQLATVAPAAPLRAFYPSSVAVADAPKGWVEYAMAKAAGEVLCRQIDRDMAGVEVRVARLPRILTDQTATVRSATAEPVLDVILPIVRDLQRA